MNYYNEHDPKAAAWLRELINQGLIPPGTVDTRSISEIKPDELHSFIQCHFFAGIGGCGDGTERMGDTHCDGSASGLPESPQRQEGFSGVINDAGSSCGAWDTYDLLPCLDGKTRRIESGTFPLAHGVPGRVAQLHGLGNAIVPQVAAQFIRAFLK